MYQLTPKELHLIKTSVGLIETDAQSFTQNLIRLGKLTREQALALFLKALNAKAVTEDRGRVRLAPPPPDPRALSDSEIIELKQAGYSVHMACDGDPPLYEWFHASSGASQSQFKHLQPLRRSQGQAWVDCRNYDQCAVPSVAEPDWMN